MGGRKNEANGKPLPVLNPGTVKHESMRRVPMLGPVLGTGTGVG